jgi:hypothetical protein
MPNIAINTSQSPLQNVLNLVDQLNTGGPTSPAQVTAGVPSATTNPNDAAVNTQLVLTAVEGQGFTGNVTIEYGRLSVAAEAASPTGNVSIASGVTDPAAVLNLVESYYGFIPGEVSWVADPTPISGGGTNTAQIQASGSLVYLDGEATVNLQWEAPKTAILMHFDGAQGATTTTDATGTVTATLKNGALIDTTVSMFGGSSLGVPLQSDATGLIPDDDALHLTGDFTIECFFTRASIRNTIICDKSVSTGSRVYVYLGPEQLVVAMDGGTTYDIGSSSAFTLVSTWFHFALVRQGTTLTAYLNGESVGSATLPDGASWGNNSASLALGNDNVTGGASQCNMDEFRISNVARYTENFTPPSAPFTLD